MANYGGWGNVFRNIFTNPGVLLLGLPAWGFPCPRLGDTPVEDTVLVYPQGAIRGGRNREACSLFSLTPLGGCSVAAKGLLSQLPHREPFSWIAAGSCTPGGR